MTQPFWERGYADLEAATFGEPSQEMRDLAQGLPAGANVLDLGCGEGRNALFLAERGFDVTAIDISETGIRKLRALAERKGLAVRSEVGDFREYAFPHPFDAIISHGCLHLVERDHWQRLIPQFKRYTKAGGFNVIVVFTDAIPPPVDLKDFCLGLFREGELFSLYSDWKIVLQQSYTFEDEHPGSDPHTHPVNKLVAQKPSEADDAHFCK